MPTNSRRSAVVSAALNLSQLDPELLLVEAETAALTRRSPRTLESWRRDGVGPKWLKLGRGVCYRVRDVREWLAAQECGGSPANDVGRGYSRATDAGPTPGSRSYRIIPARLSHTGSCLDRSNGRQSFRLPGSWRHERWD